MKSEMRWLGKWELGVLILCGMFVLFAMGAVGEKGRGRAKEVVCQASLSQWGKHFLDYAKRNDGKLYSGCNDSGYWWPLQLPQELQDWKRNRTWFCPMATTPMVSGEAVSRVSLTVNSAWGIFKEPGSMRYRGTTYIMNPNGLSGSFALNGYTLSIPDRGLYEGGVPAADGWRDFLNVPNGNAVPVFIDALRFDLWPRYTDSPAPAELAAWSSNHMTRCCINRHDGAVNCLFADGSVRRVGLKEVWTLKWYQSFRTDGPWTKAGGVQPLDWPLWMRPFKEY